MVTKREKPRCEHETEAQTRHRRETPTPRQAAVLECIRRLVRERSMTPTTAELGRELGVHPHTIDAHVDRLVRKGWLTVRSGATRSLKLLRAGTAIVETGAAAQMEDTDHDRPRIDSIAALFGESPDLYVKVGSETCAGTTLDLGDIVAIAREGEPRRGALVALDIDATVVLRPARRSARTKQTLGAALGAVVKLAATGPTTSEPAPGDGATPPLKPTKTQAVVLDYIRWHWREHRSTPTRLEIGERLGMRPQSVDPHVNALRKRGWLDIETRRNRGIRLLRPGEPVYVERAPSQIDALDPPRIDTIEALLGAEPDLFVRAGADTPGETRLDTGDIAAIARGREPADGDTVAVQIDGTVRLKRWYANNPEPWAARGSPAKIIGVAFAAVVSIAPSAGRQRGRRDEPAATADRAEGAKGGDAKRAGHGTIAAVV